MYGQKSSILLYIATYWYIILLLPVQCLRRLDKASVGTPASQHNIRTFISQRFRIILNAHTLVGLDLNVENVALGKFGVYLLRTGIYW